MVLLHVSGNACTGESGAPPTDFGGVEGNEGDSNEDEDTLDEARKPLPPPVLRSTRTKYVLCADSLGQEIALGREELRCLQLFAGEIGKTILRTQNEAVERQVRLVNGDFICKPQRTTVDDKTKNDIICSPAFDYSSSLV